MAWPPTTGLAEDVLPLIRNRSDLHRWSAANAHGRDMHEAIDILAQDEAAGPAERYAVTHKALATATTRSLLPPSLSGRHTPNPSPSVGLIGRKPLPLCRVDMSCTPPLLSGLPIG